MITQTLQLEHAPNTQAETVAWLLPGSDCAAWLRELTAAAAPTDRWTLCVIPARHDPTQPLGLLVFGEAATLTSAQAVPYQRLGAKLYLPVDAQVVPPVLPTEWDGLLSDELAVYVWHPVAGLIGCEHSELLSVADLITPPQLAAADWSHARPGLTFNTRLAQLTRAEQPTLAQFLEAGGDDIGSQADQLKNLDPTLRKSLGSFFKNIGQKLKSLFDRNGSREPTPKPEPPTKAPKTQSGNFANAASRMGKTVVGGLLFPVAWITHQLSNIVPGTASAPTWINHLDSWAQGLMQQTADLLTARQREINKLLNLLEFNPDEGLKYALPIGGESGARGVATPSGQLLRRDTNFTLGGLFGGSGPADFWDLPPETQLELNEKYRTLAQRERDLKRYQRAAYIYAHLLGDFRLAALVLVEGGYDREAAVIYLEKLHLKNEAAACYERAGEFERALAIYEQTHQFGAAANLCERLQREQEAANWFRRAVNQHISAQDFLQAADLLEHKLNVPIEAIELLISARPHGSLSGSLINRTFELMAKCGLHERAAEYQRDLRESIGYSGHDSIVAKAMLNVCQTYPLESIRTQAAQTIQVVTSRSLKNRTASAQTCLTVLAQIAPEDKLLARDTKRYRNPVQQNTIADLPTPKPNDRGVNFLGNDVWEQLPFEKDRQLLHSVISTAERFFTLSINEDLQLQLEVRKWKSSGQVEWSAHWELRDDALHAVCLGSDELQLAILPFNAPPLAMKEHQSVPGQMLRAGTPNWLDQETRGLGVMTWSDSVWALESDGTLNHFESSGQLRQSVTILQPLLELENLGPMRLPRPMHVTPQRVYLAVGRHLFVYRPHNQQVETVEFDRPIRRMFASQRTAATRLAIMFDQGGEIYWPQYGQRRSLSNDLVEPRGLFLRDGRLLLAAQSRLQIYSARNQELEWLGETELDHPTSSPLLDIVPTDETDKVAFFFQDGSVRIRKIRPR